MPLNILEEKELTKLANIPGVYDCEVVFSQVREANGVFCIILNCPTIANSARPGQFVNVRVSDGADPLLRRPLSVHTVYPEMGTFSLLYVVHGKGTELLAKKGEGDNVNVVGPLGKPFDMGDNPEARHILVSGGCGTAPMTFLCEALCKKRCANKVTVLLGGKSNDDVLCRTGFQGYVAEVGIATDDGSYGHHGFVTQLLQERLTASADDTRVYACGPYEMLKEVAQISKGARVASCQVSLEKVMACGVGACLGCAQKIANQDDPEGWDYQRVCTDGPVFEAEDVIWERI